MKLYLISILGILFFSSAFAQHHVVSTNAVLKKSELAFAGINATQEFAELFEQEKGKPLKEELIGFNAVALEDEVEVGVYHLTSETELTKDIFGCHFHYESNGQIDWAHCDDEGERQVQTYTPSERVFSVEEFEKGLVGGIEYFQSKYGDPSMIEQLKMWQVNSTLELHVKWTPPSEPQKTVYIMCHYHHGSDMDCHRHSRPGPIEPKD